MTATIEGERTPERPANEPWTVARVLRWAADDFRKRNPASPRLEAELLLAEVGRRGNVGIRPHAQTIAQEGFGKRRLLDGNLLVAVAGLAVLAQLLCGRSGQGI